MSEYQYVAFRAIDGPVPEEDQEYMGRQSSRAEITPWSFTNEYHYGDFRGTAAEMQRSLDAYEQIATLLADLREAVAGGKQAGLAEQQARRPKDENPKLQRLTAARRWQAFLPK
jgi:hypothetical protein